MSAPVLDLGLGHTAQAVSIDGELAGFDVEHDNLRATPGPGATSMRCRDWIPIVPSVVSGWKLESLEPLTMSPSLLCRVCGDHGFIRGGKWIPA